MPKMEQAQHILHRWWDALPTYKQNNGLPAQGTLAGALVVLDRLQDTYSLEISDHLTQYGMQIAGLSRPRVARILERFGAQRSLPAEGGRTNPGSIPQVRALLHAMAPLELAALPDTDRRAVLGQMQGWLVATLLRYAEPHRIRLHYRVEWTTQRNFQELLTVARSVGKEGPVAQYLVGAKLALRFPEVEVRNDSYSTSDVQSGLPGDFLVGGTAFHVTVAPMPGLYQKAVSNVEAGYRVYILVPERWVVGARQNAEAAAPGRLSVQSIEAFVSQNLDELTGFAPDAAADGFRQLLDCYNARVDAVETDKSLLIEIPHNLMP